MSPGGHFRTVSYDGNGNALTVQPPGRPDHGFTYDDADRLISSSPPLVTTAQPGSTTALTYNRDNQIETISLPGSRTIDPTYNGTGQLSRLAYGARQVDYSYDAEGRLSALAGPDGTSEHYSYDGALLLGTNAAGAGAGLLSYTYDYRFRVSHANVPNSPLGIAYNHDDQPTAVGALSLSYDGQRGGVLTGSSIGSGSTVRDSFDVNGFAEVTTYTAGLNATTGLYALSLTRDSLGRVTQKDETIDPDGSGASAPVTTTWGYWYDGDGRLIAVTRNGAAFETYTYNDNGGRTQFTTGAGHPFSTASATIDNQDRLNSYGSATFTYTPDGYLASRTDGSGTTTYSYDELGNLRTVGLPGGVTISYVIDGRNRRVAKQVNGVASRSWLYQDGLRPAGELDLSTGDLTARFVYVGDSNVPAYIDKSGDLYRLIVDQVGSVKLVVRVSDGTVAQRLEYDTFGNVLTDTNPGFQPFGYAGGLYDPDTKLTRFGARDYDPTTGRWTAKDPLGFGGGDTNLYAYVGGDPVNYTDPGGLDRTDKPHYTVMSVSAGLAIPFVNKALHGYGGLGGSAAITIDYYGNIYVTKGDAAGRVQGLGAGYMNGYLDGYTEGSVPSQETLKNFLTGDSVGGGGGAGAGVYRVRLVSSGQWSTEYGAVTPGAGAGHAYGYDTGINVPQENVWDQFSPGEKGRGPNSQEPFVLYPGLNATPGSWLDRILGKP
jgi:RHS repeat-associated protein